MRRSKLIQSSPVHMKHTDSTLNTVKSGAKTSSLTIVIIIVVLATAGVIGIKNFWFTDTDKKNIAQDQLQKPNLEGVRELIEKVSKHISVNTVEEPTVATIQDADFLRAQNPSFYKEAQNDDRVLVWSDKAVLYSTAKDQLLYVLPTLSEGTIKASTATSSSSNNEESATIEVRNGTRTAGLARIMSEKVKESGLIVIQLGDAKLKNYNSSIIVKKDDKDFPKTLELLRSLISAKIETLPAGEKPSTADILLIVGSDFTP